MTLSQRTWVPAMVPWRATETGFVTDELRAWYQRFAEGRPGVLVVEATGIRDIPSGPLLRIGHDRFIDGLRALVDTVRRASGGETRLLIQLIDFLRVRRRPKVETFFARFFSPTDDHRKRASEYLIDDALLDYSDRQFVKLLCDGGLELWRAVLEPRELSDLQYGARERVNDTDLPHISALPTTLPTMFADAAHRAQQAGFDGVELHYAHAYTMASFLSRNNRRQDGYGTSLSGRARLPLEVYEAVRARVDAEFAVGCRFLVDEVFEGGSSVDDACYFGIEFARAGMDFLSLSKGGKFEDARQPKIGQAVYPYTGQSGYECMPTVYSDQRGPFYRNIESMAKVRQAIRMAGFDTPVVVAGGINDFEGADAVLRAEHGDIVASARQSLADPDWFRKMRVGRGSEIRRCKFTNYCEALDNQHKQVTCQLWDRIDIQEPQVQKSHDGKRRLTAPSWSDSSPDSIMSGDRTAPTE
ncbi:MAG: NADH:flavin oxidoreductase [Myxococcota bacterium]|nr:NADH:flavin oxidoreductase [Myxococcota bacterium]